MNKAIKNYSCAVGFMLIVLAFQSCTSEPDYKVTRQEVLDLHDKIMMDGGKAMGLKMQLDSVPLPHLKETNPALDTAAERQKIRGLVQDINNADGRMNDWMHAFDAELTGKSNKQKVDYLNAEKLKVVALDSLYKDVIGRSESYLKQFKLKADTTAAMRKM
jgi:hypothetical protein